MQIGINQSCLIFLKNNSSCVYWSRFRKKSIIKSNIKNQMIHISMPEKFKKWLNKINWKSFRKTIMLIFGAGFLLLSESSYFSPKIFQVPIQ